MERCYFCGGRVIPKRVRHIHEWGERVLIFNDVPAEVCQQCGEVYFGPDALQMMDKVTLGQSQAASYVSVPVFSMNA